MPIDPDQNQDAALVLVPDAPEWRAEFAWSADWGGHGLTTRLFRCAFDAPADRRSFVVHVSADSRYRLWLNGRRVGFGPAKGSLARYHFETYELGPALRPGRNVLAAEVRWFGTNSPLNEVHSPVPGWLVQGPEGAGVDTPGTWRVWNSEAVTPDTTAYVGNANQFLDHLDRVDLAKVPRGWRQGDFDDRAWAASVATGPAKATGAPWGVAAMRTLVPRPIAALTEEPRRFVRTIREHREVAHVFGERPAGWSLAAGEGGVLLFDAGEYATGFPELEFDGGAGREVRVGYAEALGEWVNEGGRRDWRKAPVRDDFAHYDMHGYRDTLRLAGGADAWEPFSWRAFRFVQIEILPGDAPVALRDLRYRLCVYPQRFAAKFNSSDAPARKIFDVSVRTFRVGAHEIYGDSPYYEQLSYIADTRIETLGSLHLCNDAAMPRRTLQLFLDTLRPDGLLDARAPCQYARQTIPYFGLHWIFMVEDYWRWVGAEDAAFVRACLPAVDSILLFFRARLRGDGFLGPVGGWNMVDNVDGWPGGEPPAVTEGGSIYLTALFIEAMEVAARLHGQAGVPGDALRWLNLVDKLVPQVRSAGWDEGAGLFREQAGKEAGRFSQHAQAAAINAGIATAAQTRRILRRLCTDPAVIRARSMQAYYVARALERAGQFAGFHESILGEWRNFLAKHVTTWPEYPDPSRSDSHAWAAWPAVDYITTVLGIRPGAPGWRGARLAPQTGGLEHAEGEAPTPAGTIRVSWRKTLGRLRYEAQVPDGLLTQVVLPGQPAKTFPQGGRIVTDAAVA
ncbi:MAG TPA: family 78 glycoside hydrolase catalytic domain [Opitutus sp.]|nr:family 78 glycoside hydrolase catalytic domain [Opitutus sp.]